MHGWSTLEFEVVRNGWDGAADYAVTDGFILAESFVVGGKIDAKGVSAVIDIVAGEDPVALELLGFFAVIGKTEVESVVIRVSYIVAGIGAGIGYNIPLNGVLTAIECCWCACTKNKIGGALQFFIDFILCNDVQVMESIESVGIPFVVVDAHYFSF